MQPDQIRRAETILSMKVSGLRVLTYIYSTIVFLISFGFLMAGYHVTANLVFMAALLLLFVRLRYLSVVELMQNYHQFKYGGENQVSV